MSEIVQTMPVVRQPGAVPARLRRRYAAEKRFKIYGIAAIVLALAMLALLIGTIAMRGIGAFSQTMISIDVAFDAAVLDPDGTGDPEVIRGANFAGLVKQALYDRFPDVSGRRDKRSLAKLVSSGSDVWVRDLVLEHPHWIGTTQTVTVPASSDIDMLNKGRITRDVPETERRVSDKQIAWFDSLAAAGAVHSRFNTTFLSTGDSREPELAGVWGAIVGSMWAMVICVALAVPLGVTSAIYLEEFAPRNRWSDLVEVSINNLAAVPSIVFGLLGLAVFLNFFGLPRSAPLVGGMVLALMTLPTVIIATRVAIQAVPPSIREGAFAVGASPMQAVLHHVLPLATPGIMTGTIIGLARALGETAPLLMIGMVAFIVDVPQGPTDPATALPVQIFLWSDSPERGFVEKTAAATLILLAFLIIMNATAVFIRRKFERRW